MSDDDFLELFSNFLMALRVKDVSHSTRHRILHQAEAALNAITLENHIDSVNTSPSKKLDPSSSSDVYFSDTQKPVLEKIGRAIFMQHPNHRKMREIFELLDVDQDGTISADDLHRGLQIYMKSEIPVDELRSIVQAFDKNQKEKLHYFQFVRLLQVAMQNAIEDEDKIIHSKRPSFLSDERELLNQIGLYIDSSPHSGLIKELFFHLSKTYAHLVTSDEILEFCRRSHIISANKDVVDRIVDHFNPRADNSSLHALSYAQFARLCSESANRNFKLAPEADNSASYSSAEENLANLSLNV